MICIIWGININLVPQLDRLTYGLLCFWIFFILYIFYYFFSIFFLPFIYKNLLIRGYSVDFIKIHFLINYYFDFKFLLVNSREKIVFFFSLILNSFKMLNKFIQSLKLTFVLDGKYINLLYKKYIYRFYCYSKSIFIHYFLYSMSIFVFNKYVI